MKQRAVQRQKQRTLIIGAGRTGLAVVQALQRRLAKRRLEASSLACLAVVGNDESPTTVEEPGGCQLRVVTLEACSAATSRLEARKALGAAQTAITAALVGALGQVSRISAHLPGLQGSYPRWSQDVAVYVVAALDEVVGGAVLLELASLVRRLIGQRLNVAAEVTGLLFLPDPSLSDDPSPAMARNYAALRELEAGMRSKSGARTSARNKEPLQAEEPAFQGGCYLLGAFNGEGLCLEKPRDRIELAAEALLQLALTPLGSGPAAPLTVWQGVGTRPQSYMALGLSAWVYPRHVLGDMLAHRLAGEILSAWLEGGTAPSPAEEDISAAADVFVTEGMARAEEALLSLEALAESDLWRPLTTCLGWKRIRRLAQDLEDEAAARLEPLATQRPELDRQADVFGTEMAKRLAQSWTLRLDRAAPGGLAEAMLFLAEVQQRLADLKARLEAAADAGWQNLERLDVQLTSTREALQALVACFPQPSVRAVLGLCHPRRLFRLVMAYRQVPSVSSRYSALLARQMAVAMKVLQHDLLVRVCERVQEDGQKQQAQLTALQKILGEARQELYTAGEQMSDTPVAQWGIRFSLERSVLTPETVERLYTLVRGELDERLAEVASSQGTLSAWVRTQPDTSAVADLCLEYAHQRCQELDGVTVDELLLDVLPNADLRAEALRGLVALASPFLGWDETGLQDAEFQGFRKRVLIGPGEGTASPLLEGVGDVPGAEVVATGDSQRVTVLSVVRGLPLTALAGLGEYADAYQRLESADLHTTPEWRALPDLLDQGQPDDLWASAEAPLAARLS